MRQVTQNNSILNAWEMLKYIYDELRSKRFKNLDISICNNLDDLYALVITTWCASLAKEGLYKEYVEQEPEELASPRGQINIVESISKQTFSRGTLICEYDELSEDIYINHILKGMLQYLNSDRSINELIKLSIKKTLQMFNGVSYIDIRYIQWKDVKFSNNTIRYKHLIDMCKTLLTERKLVSMNKIDDNKRLYLLCKKQLLKYCKLSYGEEDTIDCFNMPFTLDSESDFEVSILKNQHMIAVRTETDALVYMIRLQDEQMSKQPKLPRQRVDELIRYLREYKKQYKVKASGVIVYVNTDKNKVNIQPLLTNSVDSYMIGEITVDIHDNWKYVTTRIDDCYTYFIGRTKSKSKRSYNR